eukprot:CAMPEP_0170078146 /NCGR_PEP_ID=MMETSP0019_2-20121128/14796_1 /TAXON_ID=98059 /ORGANISM="Dinobryon sp., Strain UTEXLB2267" /LENGTH=327 /DNA_ID=CAMNT_0010290849 /DNA_START=445 /DNA_END=1428 /DNA_ORIENTATION=+
MKYKDIINKSHLKGSKTRENRGELTEEHLSALTNCLSQVPGVQCVLYNYNAHPLDANILGSSNEVDVDINRNNKIQSVDNGDVATQLLFGVSPYIHDQVAGVNMRVSLYSFMQSNPLQAEVLYRKVVEVASLHKNLTVWDLYSGVGSISLFIAPLVKRVVAVEDCEAAVRDALFNAKLNDVQNVEFLFGKAEEVLANAGKDSKEEENEVVIINPPRKGCAESLLRALRARRSVERVIYVSCNPKTLARDLAILTASDDDDASVSAAFSVSRLCPVDMFPHTTHVEVVCLLTRNHNNNNNNDDSDSLETVRHREIDSNYEVTSTSVTY